ncbi:MAG: GMC family oxidoreductase [Planctomycetota bacterium]|nr:GMC family oxidoreductase [Planctomycetota bacterium]
MIRELSHAHGEELPTYDVCVVGSGPAGMTLAAELAASGRSVCVLESGGRRPTPYGDRLRAVECDGIEIKEYSRERVLGGASTTWAGLSSPLDAIDCEARPQRPDWGWPITRAELIEDYQRAAERYRFAPLELFEPDGFAALRREGDLQPTWRHLEEKVFLAAAEPQDFGREWRHVFEGEGADLYLDATVLRLEHGDDDARITHALAASPDGRTHAVRARRFILATGGIENARLLLNSRDRSPAGLGNEHDQVGRHLMNHPKNYHGLIRLARPVRELPYYFGCLKAGFAGYAGLRLSERTQRERDCLNAYVRFEPLFPWSDNLGVEAFVLLVKRSRRLLRFWKRRHEDDVVTLRDYAETGDDSELQNERKSALGWLKMVGLVGANAFTVARYVVARLSSGASPIVKTIRVRNFMEMEPCAQNRVVLGEDTDAHGQPVPLVCHHPTELDRRSLIALHEVLGEELERNGIGVFTSDLAHADPWPIDYDASHHMGTTRMGTDPEHSVVNPDCRLHSVENVYLAGSSVFPTSGCANPTFTIVALAIRLARHLDQGGAA